MNETPQANGSDKPTPIVVEQQGRSLPKQGRLNYSPYMIAFGAVSVLVLAVVAFVLIRGSSDSSFVTTELSPDELAKLAESGDIEENGRSLVINANSEIVGTLSVKNNLEVVGSLAIGGGLTLPDITVANDALLNAAQVNQDINVAGNGFFGSQVTVNGLLSANGGLTVNGELTTSSINTSNLIFSGDLQLSRHVRTSGSPAGGSKGTAVGAGGTVSIGGNDIAGTVTINTGSGTSAGSLITVTFNNPYPKTPRVLITPIGSSAAGIGYYISRTANGFTIFASSPPASSSNFSFDYFVIE